MTFASAGITTGGEVPQDGLLAYYPMGGGTLDSTTVYDQSGNGNDIPRNGTTSVTHGLQFDGVDDYLGAANLGAANAQLTISTWLDNSGGKAFGVSTGSEANYMSCLNWGGQIQWQFYGNTFEPALSAFSDTDTHLVVKMDGSQWTIKLDDSVAASGSVSQDGVSGDMYLAIGAEFNGTSGTNINGYYGGTMHDFAVYDRYTTASEDTQLYEAG